MRHRADTAELSPDELLAEIASILARGVLRLRRRAALPPEIAEHQPGEKTSPAGLEVSDETVLSVHPG